MKLRNKKTGEIRNIKLLDTDDYLVEREVTTWKGEPLSLTRLYEEWEDYEEPKNQYYLDCDGGIFEHHTTEYIKNKMKEIGNYFETKEEAEKAVEKLKAWKRLKDKGFKFVDFNRVNDCASLIRATFDEGWSEIYDDLNTCFGGEE